MSHEVNSVLSLATPAKRKDIFAIFASYFVLEHQAIASTLIQNKGDGLYGYL
jgi:hypothetical protein